MARFRDRLNDVLDMIDRVGDTGVLGFRTIVEINRAVRANHHVFQQRITTNRVIDIWLCGFGEFNGLGIAAAFEVEDAIVIPAVFVIADQAAFRIGGKGGFAGAGEAKEDRHVAFLANVSGTVHRRDTLQRQQVVHDREHPFLHFAAVPGPADQLDPLRQVEGNEVFRVESLLLPLRVGAFGAVHHDEIRLKVGQFFIAWANKHVLDEVCLPGHFGNEAYAQTCVGIGAAERINDEQTLAGKLMGDQIFQVLPGFLRERFVVVFTVAFIRPPHGIAGCIVTNDIFIFRRATGKNTGIDGDRSQIG